MNAQELIELLNKYKITPDLIDELGEFPNGDDPLDELDISKDELKKFGEVILVESQGGEGQGDSCSLTLWFKDFNIYLKVLGYYSSYEGKDYSGYVWYEVKPVERTVTFYE